MLPPPLVPPASLPPHRPCLPAVFLFASRLRCSSRRVPSTPCQPAGFLPSITCALLPDVLPTQRLRGRFRCSGSVPFSHRRNPLTFWPMSSQRRCKELKPNWAFGREGAGDSDSTAFEESLRCAAT